MQSLNGIRTRPRALAFSAEGAITLSWRSRRAALNELVDDRVDQRL